jgi:hypothetical protein
MAEAATAAKLLGKDHDHDTLTALHCNDPRADRVSQRASTDRVSRRRRLPWPTCQPSPNHRLHMRPHDREGCMHQCATAGASATKQAAATLNAPKMKRLLFATTLILAGLTAQANAQSSYGRGTGFGGGLTSIPGTPGGLYPSWSIAKGDMEVRTRSRESR